MAIYPYQDNSPSKPLALFLSPQRVCYGFLDVLQVFLNVRALRGKNLCWFSKPIKAPDIRICNFIDMIVMIITTTTTTIIIN